MRAVEDGGVDYITVHGRRRSDRSSEPVNLEAIRLVKQAAKVPVVANGDAYSLEDVHRIASITRADGTSVAHKRYSFLLTNSRRYVCP